MEVSLWLIGQAGGLQRGLIPPAGGTSGAKAIVPLKRKAYYGFRLKSHCVHCEKTIVPIVVKITRQKRRRRPPLLSIWIPVSYTPSLQIPLTRHPPAS